MSHEFNKISLLVKSQLPEYIRSNYDTFAAFLKAYYEFLEDDDEARGIIQTSNYYKDVDKTLDMFVDYFLKEFVYGVPLSVFDPNDTESKRFLVKHINKLYRSKGSPNALKFLFRLAFDEEIDVIFPNDYLLRPSDGKWAKTALIRTSITSNLAPNLDSLLYKTICNEDESIECPGIENYILQPDGTYYLYVDPTHFSENDLQFRGGEFLHFDDANVNANVTVSVLNTLVSIDIIDGGLGYKTTDAITIVPSGPTAHIETVNESGKITAISIVENGANVASNTTVTVVSSGTRTASYTLRANVATIILDSNIKHGLSLYDTVNLTISGGTLANGNYIVSEVLNKKIFQVQHVAANSTGNLTISYRSNANLLANIGTIIRGATGYGLSVDGQLDTTILIQDSYKWQQYSYIVRSSLDIDTWLDLVKTTLHPAGLAIFGEVTLYSSTGNVESIYAGPIGTPASATDRSAYDSFIQLILVLINDSVNDIGMSSAPDSYYGIEVYDTPEILDGATRTSAGATLEVLDQFKFEYGNAFPINIIQDFTIDSINPVVKTNFQPPSYIEAPYRDTANANLIYSISINA